MLLVILIANIKCAEEWAREFILSIQTSVSCLPIVLWKTKFAEVYKSTEKELGNMQIRWQGEDESAYNESHKEKYISVMF